VGQRNGLRHCRPKAFLAGFAQAANF
jgi:hypothetical protein